ncbi:FtsB family cell division protein [Leucobacter sp. W1153]|uniref:FtsB family cell division protein n=1 Tax=unclassified Leucobacter TaxID=2621730 RepID=UPI003F40D6F8
MAKRIFGEVGDWVASLRFSGFTVLIVALIAVGAIIVSPTLSTYVQQQRELAELRESVQLNRDAVADADAERLKWQDPSYVRSQARGRLFYVMPGETQLNVIDDIVIPADSVEVTSEQLTRIQRNWVHTLVSSALIAGTTNASPDALPGAMTDVIESVESTGSASETPAPLPIEKESVE